MSWIGFLKPNIVKIIFFLPAIVVAYAVGSSPMLDPMGFFVLVALFIYGWAGLLAFGSSLLFAEIVVRNFATFPIFYLVFAYIVGCFLEDWVTNKFRNFIVYYAVSSVLTLSVIALYLSSFA